MDNSAMISVVICTYNRGSSLEQTLEGLRATTVPIGLRWEIVVVDNNSDDNTREVVERVARTSGLNVRYVFEPKQGLSQSRNTGIANSTAEIVVFIDDDILTDADWLGNLWREFCADRELGVLGGRVELSNPQDLPLTIVRSTTRKVIRSFVDVDGMIGGCCFGFRRSLWDNVGEFDILLGPGGKFSNADDIDFLYRTCRRGWKILYAPSVLVYHNHGRRTHEAGAALLRSYNIGRGAFYAKHLLSGDMFAARLMYWTISSRMRLFFRGRNMAGCCRNTGYLIGGFLAYVAYRVSCAFNPARKFRGLHRASAHPGPRTESSSER
jgi:glycosyltransferase involved in cell wall biosynthesis